MFRMRPTATKMFPFLFLLSPDFPDASDFFRLVPDASDRHNVPLPVPVISGFFRRVPDASRRQKLDRAPGCLETEAQQFVLLGITMYLK